MSRCPGCNGSDNAHEAGCVFLRLPWEHFDANMRRRASLVFGACEADVRAVVCDLGLHYMDHGAPIVVIHSGSPGRFAHLGWSEYCWVGGDDELFDLIDGAYASQRWGRQRPVFLFPDPTLDGEQVAGVGRWCRSHRAGCVVGTHMGDSAADRWWKARVWVRAKVVHGERVVSLHVTGQSSPHGILGLPHCWANEGEFVPDLRVSR